MHDNLKRSRLNKAFFSIVVLSLFLFLSNGCSKLSNLHLPGVEDLDLQLVADNLVSPLSVIEAPDSIAEISFTFRGICSPREITKNIFSL
jgi:hypothetical protein